MNVGDIIRFGKYNWRVLSVQDEKALIITEDIIAKSPFHTALENTTWAECDMRRYLNEEFYREFTEAERQRIVPVINKNLANPWYLLSKEEEIKARKNKFWFERAKGEDDTLDNVFLLSLEEIVQYFGDSGDLKNKKGWFYNERKKKYILACGGSYLNDEYNGQRIAKIKNKPYRWWLRTFGSHNQAVVVVLDDGCIAIHAHAINNTNGGGGGIRPALWLKTDLSE